MKFHKCFRMALNLVLHSRLRSWLTIIGIVIGVASVITIVGIGNGLSSQIQSNLGILNADIITISPGYSKAVDFGPPDRGTSTSSSSADQEPITNKEVQILKSINNIEYINTKISGSVDIYYSGKEGKATVTGVNVDVYSKISSTKILSGRNLDGADSNVIVIGNNLATKYFEKEILINQLLTIEGRTFRVIGILDDNSNSIIMPINSAYEVLSDKTKFEYDTIEVKVKNADILNETEKLITTKLMRSRHVDEKTQDFTVRTNAQSNTTRAQVMTTITTFLTAIASISLIVGAVGIANTMFTAVLEKTKEIGIMKAIGARNNDILLIFLLNAALIGFAGGILGVAIGYLLAYILTSAGLVTIISLSTVMITLLISIAVGIISGLIPAINASKLDPVEALRRD